MSIPYDDVMANRRAALSEEAKAAQEVFAREYGRAMKDLFAPQPAPSCRPQTCADLLRGPV